MRMKNWQVQAFGLLLLALLLLFSVPLFMKKIPDVLQHTAQQELKRNGMDWVAVNARGRNITLGGQAPDIQHHQQALDTLDQVYGVRDVTDNMNPRIVDPYTFEMRWTGEKLHVKGFVSHQENYTAFLESAFKVYGKDNVSGDVQLGAGAPDHWDDLLQQSLQSLKTMEQGVIDITNQSIHVSGKSVTSDTKYTIQRKLSAYTEHGYQPSMHIVAADAADLICQQRFTELLASKSIQFKSGKTDILPASFSLLTKLSDTASLCSKSIITVAGHTDSQGNPESNHKLSEKRAEAVVAWLFQQGIEIRRLNAMGYGASKPVGDNKTEQGRARNRRIEFIVGGN